MYFQWALGNDLAVPAATRAHVELYRFSISDEHAWTSLRRRAVAARLAA
jgi:hypothetical protein